MAVNLATKYEKQFAAAFAPTSFLNGRVNEQYSFDGAKTIMVYSPVTVPLTNYTRSGANRYGSPAEMSTAVQKMELTQDKGFAQTIDRGNYTDSMMAISAANWMAEEIKGVVVPEMEKNAFGNYVKYGNVIAASGAISKSNITAELMELFEAQTDAFVPDDNKTLFVTSATATLIKTSPEFVGIDSLGEKAIGKGVIGMFSGAPVVVLPVSYLPTDAHAVLARKDSIMCPKKIASYKTHQNPPGIDGWLCEGRVYYDGFVLGAKVGGVTTLCTTAKKQACSVAIASHTCTITASGASSVLYTDDGTDPRFSPTAKTYSAAFTTTAGTVITAVAFGGSSTPFTSALATATDA